MNYEHKGIRATESHEALEAFIVADNALAFGRICHVHAIGCPINYR